MNCDLWIVIVEGESDWNDHDVYLPSLSSLYAQEELDRHLHEVFVESSPSLSRSIYIRKKMKKKMKAEQVKEEKARSFVGKKKVWCSGWGKVPDPCSFVEVNPTTRFKNCRGIISWRGGEGGRKKRRCTLNSIICCISKYTFVLNFCGKKFFFSCVFEKKKTTCIREITRQPP